jgi:hypothetical protein
LRLFLPSLLAILLLGCTAPSHPTTTDRATIATPVIARVSGETIEGIPGACVELPHYVIHSTIPDPEALQKIGQVLEGARQAYRSLAPQVPSSSYPMECYFFETRPQWAAYTKAHTGDDAAIYLRVNRGGYTINDKFVAYWIGQIGTYSVAAHEGFHQYVARHLKGRLPPFLEEGLACMFEQVEWVEQGKNMQPLPSFDVRKNHARLIALRIAADSNDIYPLQKLITMHAGQVVGKRSAQIEAFYAESWAFARFLHERHPESLRRMLVDASKGQLFADSSTQDAMGAPLWDPKMAQPMIEHYLDMKLPSIEAEFARYVKAIVD